MKNKYYRNCNLLDAQLGPRPSFIWRSFISAMELVKEGLLWRVGNGSQIRIWGTKWIPIPASHIGQSPITVLDEIATVRDVKIAYHLKIERIRKKQGETSARPTEESTWKILWNLKVPGTVKHFIWRACHDILPMERPWCPVCERLEETSIHALWSCPAVSDVWGDKNNPLKKCTKLKMEELDYVVIVMRNIWTRRNAVSFDNKFDRPETILQKAIMSLESFYFAQQLGLVQNANAVMVMRGLGQWRKPAEHYVKANWDAAVDIKSKTTGLGVIIRDAESFSHVIFVWDYHENVNAINAQQETWIVASSLIYDIKSMLKTRLGWTVSFSYRETNQHAHKLSKLALSMTDEHIWMEECPMLFPMQILDVVVKEKVCND
ncbi:hypothetical protein I3842_08G097700 [Carya illinoinensis]|uniref:Reverse transcriptase zinc-binding domain-containing protein n=1 Tax=Carya illinoinensis TaxID=32201 RepID=A0A922JA76_CARIL|nr:hypothetical protein I3842_08G097700 [Carya illinoinensis]